MPSGVYSIENTVTGSVYVGSAVDVSARWRAHRSSLSTHGKSPPKLQRAWDKHGPAAFKFSVLEVCEKAVLLATEQRWIDTLAPRYNTRKTATSNLGVVWTAQTNKAKGRPKRLLTYGDVTLGMSDMARAHNITPAALKNRLLRGVLLPDALTTPMASYAERGARGIKRGNPKVLTAFGRTGSLQSLVAAVSTVSYAAVVRRRCLGWTLERALAEPRCK